VDMPEKKSPTEPLDVQRKIEDIMTGKRAIDILYPYIPPDYKIPFLHIGTEKQLFLDNFILDHMEGVQRVFPKPMILPLFVHRNHQSSCHQYTHTRPCVGN